MIDDKTFAQIFKRIDQNGDSKIQKCEICSVVDELVFGIIEEKKERETLIRKSQLNMEPDQPMINGTLNIKIQMAEIERNLEYYNNKMDPYLVLKFKDQTCTTKVLDNAH